MREQFIEGIKPERIILIERIRKLLEIELNLRSVSFLSAYNDSPGQAGVRIEPDGSINDNPKLTFFKDNLFNCIECFFKKVRGCVDTGKEFDSIKIIIGNVLYDENEKKVSNLIERLCSCNIVDLIIGDTAPDQIEVNFKEYAKENNEYHVLGLKYVRFEDDDNSGTFNLHLQSVFLENPFKLKRIILQEFRALAGFLIDQISHQEISGDAEVCLDSWIVYENEKIFSSAGFALGPSDIKRYFNEQYPTKKATMSVLDFIKKFATKN